MQGCFPPLIFHSNAPSTLPSGHQPQQLHPEPMGFGELGLQEAFMVGKPSESSTGHGENEELGLDSSSEDCEGVGVNIPSANSEESALLVPLSSRLHAWLHLCSGPAVTSIWILGFTGKLSSKFVPSSAATQQEKITYGEGKTRRDFRLLGQQVVLQT